MLHPLNKKPSPIHPDDPSQVNHLGSRMADGNGNGRFRSRGTCYRLGVSLLAHGSDAKRPRDWTTGGEIVAGPTRCDVGLAQGDGGRGEMGRERRECREVGFWIPSADHRALC